MFEGILAKSMSNLGTETAFSVLAKAKALEAQGRDVVHLEIGEPDFDTPPNIVEAAVRALREGYTHYTPAPGLPEVRAAIGEHSLVQRGVEYDPEEIVITPGAKPIMFFTILALVNPGDEVIYPDPGFPIYESLINYVGGKAVPVPLREENDFRLDAGELSGLITPRTKLLILNSPANPTGGILLERDMEDIAGMIRGKGIMVLSDEVYGRIVYDGFKPVSMAAMPGMKDWTIVLDGFSKTYSMTGWRLGYGLMHPEMASWITRLMINSNSCTAAFVQNAGQEALTGPQDLVDAMVSEFDRRRQLVVSGLNSIDGISCKTPKGAFYAFPNVKGVGRTSQELEELLLSRAGVATLSGTSFGKAGDGYLRLSFANSMENLEKALERIRGLVERL